MKRTAVLALAIGLFASTIASAEDAKKVTILASMRSLENPFFIVMMNAIKSEADKIGGVEIIEADGQDSSTKQTADVETAVARGVDGVLISPADVNALVPALQESVDAGVATGTIDSNVNKVNGLFAHVGADNFKGGQAQGELIKKLFPDGATVVNLQGLPGAGPAIARNEGVHDVLDKDSKYEFVVDQTANFDRNKALSVTEAALTSLSEPPDVIVAASDDMALGAMEAIKGHGLAGKVVIIGFDGNLEALVQIRDGGLTATIEQFPGKQSALALKQMVTFLRTGEKPGEQVTLLTPIIITKDNLSEAEHFPEM
jgi:ABC-type sugar transport system substrate-binding protein